MTNQLGLDFFEIYLCSIDDRILFCLEHRLKVACLKAFVEPREPTAILPGVDQIVAFEDAPLPSVKLLVARWSTNVTENQALKEEYASDVAELYAQMGYSKSRERVEASECSHSVLGRLEAELACDDNDYDYVEPDPVVPTVCVPRSIRPPAIQPPPGPAQIPYRTETAATARKSLKESLNQTSKRIWDGLDPENAVTIPAEILLVCERWPEYPARRVYSELRDFLLDIPAKKRRSREEDRRGAQNPGRQGSPRHACRASVPGFGAQSRSLRPDMPSCGQARPGACTQEGRGHPGWGSRQAVHGARPYVSIERSGFRQGLPRRYFGFSDARPVVRAGKDGQRRNGRVNATKKADKKKKRGARSGAKKIGTATDARGRDSAAGDLVRSGGCVQVEYSAKQARKYTYKPATTGNRHPQGPRDHRHVQAHRRSVAVGGSDESAAPILRPDEAPSTRERSDHCSDALPHVAVGSTLRGCGSDTHAGCQLDERSADDSCKAAEEHKAQGPAEVAHSYSAAGSFAVPEMPALAGPTRGDNHTPDVPPVPQLHQASPRPELHDLQHPSVGVRDPPPEAGQFGANPASDAPCQCGTAPLVPRTTNPGRSSGPSPGDKLALRAHLSHERPLYNRPVDIMARCLTWYNPEVPTKAVEGVLDPIPPNLAARVDLARFLGFPPSSPLGRAARLLASPTHLRDFQLWEFPPLVFTASSSKHKRFIDELINAGLCTVNRRALGFAKFFTVEKKVNEDGVPILRTILDCQRANQIFVEPDPVNLSTVAEMVQALDGAECIRTLDLRHMYHQIRIHEHLQPYFTVALGAVRLRWSVLPMGWKWACCIAQAITTYAVAGDVARAWTSLPHGIRRGNCVFFVCYDNVIGGGPYDELSSLWSDIVHRIEDPDGINAVIKEQDCAVRGGSVDKCLLVFLCDR
eukprot:PhM_4_TR18715/c1_g2_i8/m.62335